VHEGNKTKYLLTLVECNVTCVNNFWFTAFLLNQYSWYIYIRISRYKLRPLSLPLNYTTYKSTPFIINGSTHKGIQNKAPCLTKTQNPKRLFLWYDGRLRILHRDLINYHLQSHGFEYFTGIFQLTIIIFLATIF
jgi:hypothetical protein